MTESKTFEASKPQSPSASATTPETPQTEVWRGTFGREYTDRNTFEIDALDSLYRNNYGITRTQINRDFVGCFAKDGSFLEVGCNTGNQLLLLQRMGYTNLSGVELQSYALEIARSRTRNISLEQGSALALPYDDASFDVVFTSGVLIHIAPEDIPRAMSEIHRVARSFIWGLEYFAPNVTEVNYRQHNGLLWKMNYAQRYLDQFDDLELIREKHIPYLEGDNVDTVFLLHKKNRPT
jgi:pseudaminic acid biosynthesis-associated methylase